MLASKLKHTKRKGTLINYEIIAFCAPSLFAGTFIGVIFN